MQREMYLDDFWDPMGDDRAEAWYDEYFKQFLLEQEELWIDMLICDQ